MLVLMTGEIGCGKTTACRRALARLQARGMTPSGILTPARLDARGHKVGIDVLDLSTGQTHRLATYAAGGGETVGCYTFDKAALRWAIARLKAAVDAGPELLVVDEIGPLELIHGGGFVDVLDPLADPQRVSHGLVIVRQVCVATLEARLARPDARRFWIDRANRDAMPAQIAEAFKKINAETQRRRDAEKK
jgi:nucleoside-triphosphatase THEP1